MTAAYRRGAPAARLLRGANVPATPGRTEPRWYDRGGPRDCPPPARRSSAGSRSAPHRRTAPHARARPGPGPQPRGLKQQAGATRDALIALVRAHIDLAKAEASEIGDEIKVVAAAVGVAIAAVIFIAFLVPIGIALFLGEWLFGSLGW
ncbi:MAG TPA: hypothetical protein VFY23_14380, partial [Candidatus Limnocylindrales bacterium]|nr:hypothetical protein [Candidatus Limnocylindrales bacterium]